MKQAPYSLSEATDICKEFQFIIGQPFGAAGDDVIECVTVTPFDEINKNRFIMYYLLFEDANMALSQDYQGLLYDVLIIARSKDNHELRHENIHAWLQKSRPMSCYNIEVVNLAPRSVIVEGC